MQKVVERERVVGRRRSRCARVLGALAAVLTGVWVYSGWYWITFWEDQRPPTSVWVGLGNGTFGISRETPPPTPGGQTTLAIGTRSWYVDWTAFSSGVAAVKLTEHSWFYVALWPPALGAAVGAGALWCSARRARAQLRAGRCGRCGYEMVRQQGGERAGELVCPECGPVVRRARRVRGRAWKVGGVALTSVGALLLIAWGVSCWWKLSAIRNGWWWELQRGAVVVYRYTGEDAEEWPSWWWEGLAANDRGFAWRANCDGYPNGPALWSWEMSWDQPEQVSRVMVVLWPWWLLTGGAGMWMMWSCRGNWKRNKGPQIEADRFGFEDLDDAYGCG